MPSIALLGATGNLGRHIARQVLERGWSLSVAVRNRSRLAPETLARARVTDLDLSMASIEQLALFADGHQAFVFCAGVVTEGEAFVQLVDKAVCALETIPSDRRPVCWFLAGAALLALDASGRRGVDLPKIRDTYWPHRKNFERLQASGLDWRILCPSPMVEQAALGLQRLRLSTDGLPVVLPAITQMLPAPFVLPLFAMKIPEMIIPYADAAAVILSRMEPGDPTSRHRIGIALPAGMRGRKDQWAAQPRKRS
jgi:putative NADH-flavin reductase